jgi:hypothetical protein
LHIVASRETSGAREWFQGILGRKPYVPARAGASRRTEVRRTVRRYFLAKQVFVVASQVMSFIFSQSALVLGGSAAKAGAEAASRRPAIKAKLSVFMDVSYLFEHLQDADALNGLHTVRVPVEET